MGILQGNVHDDYVRLRLTYDFKGLACRPRLSYQAHPEFLFNRIRQGFADGGMIVNDDHASAIGASR